MYLACKTRIKRICDWICKNRPNCHNNRNCSYIFPLSRHTKYEAIDGQVCFHRQFFADPVKPRRSTTESMGPLMGTNKAAWGVKLLLTTIWSYQVDCGSFCALLKTQYCCLPPCGWCCPPSASHPPPTSTPPPSCPRTPYKLHPCYYRSCKKPPQKPADLAR